MAKSIAKTSEPDRAATPFDPYSYWQDRLQTYSGLLGVGYTILGQRYNEWQYKLRRRIFLRMVRSLQIDWKSAQVLDIGSGTGFYIDRWKEVGVRSIDGLDLTDVAVSALRAQYPCLDFYRHDIGESLPLPTTKHYDAVSAFDVLFHIVDDQRYERAIKKISDLLLPGGWLLFSDLFLHSETHRIEHVVCRTLSDVERLVLQAGLEVVDRKPMFVLMNIPLDSTSKTRLFFWKLLTFPATKSELVGYTLGLLLYLLDVFLTRALQESPTTEIMICRKPIRSAFSPCTSRP